MSWLYGVIGSFSGLLLLSAAILIAVMLFAARKDLLSDSQSQSRDADFTEVFQRKVKRPTSVRGEKVPDEVLTVVIDSDDDLYSSSEDDQSDDDDDSRESSSREPSHRLARGPLIPKLSLPKRKSASVYKPTHDSDDEDFADIDSQLEALMNGDDDEDEDESELPSKFSNDDYIDEAVSNEKDPLSQIPADTNVSYFQPTARLLSKIGKKLSVSQSALTNRLGNIIGLKADNISEPASNPSSQPSTTPTVNFSPEVTSKSILKLSLPPLVPEETIQTRTRNNSLFARLSLSFAPVANQDSNELNDDKDSNLEEIALDAAPLNRRKKHSKLIEAEESDNSASDNE